jgi:maltose/moltooligosaccharide transporter
MTKSRLSFVQIWNMSFGFFGIQVAFALQNANASRIFQTLGAEVDQLPLLWIAAPVTGLLVQPIIGYMSDRTWGRLGRRRPYFFYGALLTTAALIVMPQSPVLWVAAIMLWVMDASINVTMEPFRAFVGDMLPEEQRTLGFATQSFFIGLGAVLASALPWMLTNWAGVSNMAAEGQVPDSVRLAFWFGAAALLVAVMWTVFTTREYSPEQMEAFEQARRDAEPDIAPQQPGTPPAARRLLIGGAVCLVLGFAVVAAVGALRLEKELYILAGFAALVGAVQLIAGLLRNKGAAPNGFSEVVDDLFQLPTTMRQLAVVQFFSWFALFAMWIYTTAAVTSFHYGVTDTASAAYNDGANWVGVLFAAYNGVAALAALLIPPLAQWLGRRLTHAVNLCFGALGLLSFVLIRDPDLLWIGMIGVGFAWASILSMPYAILAGALPAKKMGVFMGIFNFFIVIPQLLAATVLGLLIKSFFGGQAIWALVLGAGSFFVAAICLFGVTDPADKRRFPVRLFRRSAPLPGV